MDLDLPALLGERRARPSRRAEGGQEEPTVIVIAGQVIRAELWLRARGKSLLTPHGTAGWLAEKRARKTPCWGRSDGGINSKGRVPGDLEAGLVWLATRGLVECVEEGEQDECGRYRWTRNATDERLGRYVR